MAGYLGTKAVFLSTTAASVTGNASVGGDFTVDTNTLYVDSTNNNVGIGTSSPASELHISSASSTTFRMQDEFGTGSYHDVYTAGNNGENLIISANTGDTAGGSLRFYEGNTERMRIDASGNVLVGKTSSTFNNTAGIGQFPSGRIYVTRDGGNCLYLNRVTSDGNIAAFYKDSTLVGSIGTASDGDFFIASGVSGGCGIQFQTANILPATNTGAAIDNNKDWGGASFRWDDIYATNGTIQTSDRNEKQQIASLTDAEMQAAKAISALFKTFKWNDKVAEKGDAARKHTGVIAQDVQQAMSDAGLDAGDYAFFISSTWWETQTEVPAVEAVEAQDAVYDEEGNLISEAVEAVEAREAYTRTDTYDTLEEAPEGATERTRLGIRYPELLAFIGAATNAQLALHEQRLASIEARLDALEGV